MYFAKTFVALALAAVAAAQSTSLYFTNTNFDLQAGKPFTITYKAADLSSPVTILLRKGASNDLTTVETISSDATGGSYVFTPSSTLAPADNYAFEITQGSEINYTKQFAITGGSDYKSAYMSSSISNAMSSMIASYNATKTAPSNATITPYYPTGGYPTASGTGVMSMPRNTTFSSATLRAPSTTVGPTGMVTVPAPAATTSSSGATALGSRLALVIGVFGALVYFN